MSCKQDFEVNKVSDDMSPLSNTNNYKIGYVIYRNERVKLH